MLQLLGGRCADCGTISTPPSIHPACIACGGTKLEPVPLARRGPCTPSSSTRRCRPPASSTSPWRPCSPPMRPCTRCSGGWSHAATRSSDTAPASTRRRWRRAPWTSRPTIAWRPSAMACMSPTRTPPVVRPGPGRRAARDRGRREEAPCGSPSQAGGELFLAMGNRPHQAVLVGEAGAAARARELAVADGLMQSSCRMTARCTRPCSLPSPRTYGPPSPGFPCARPSMPMWSCTTAAPCPEGPEEMRELLVEHWTRPVRFRETVEALYADGGAGVRRDRSARQHDLVHRGHPAGPTGMRGCRRRPSAYGHAAAQPPRRAPRRARRRAQPRLPVLAPRPTGDQLAPTTTGRTPDAGASSAACWRSRCRRPGRCCGSPSRRWRACAPWRPPIPPATATRRRPSHPPAPVDERAPVNEPAPVDAAVVNPPAPVGAPVADALGWGAGGPAQDAAVAVADHLQTMQQFLLTQREVMQAYLARLAGDRGRGRAVAAAGHGRRPPARQRARRRAGRGPARGALPARPHARQGGLRTATRSCSRSR